MPGGSGPAVPSVTALVLSIAVGKYWGSLSQKETFNRVTSEERGYLLKAISSWVARHRYSTGRGSRDCHGAK